MKYFLIGILPEKLSKNVAVPNNIQDKIKMFSNGKSKKIISEVKKNSRPDETSSASIENVTVCLEKLCERPSGLTEVRRDGKDNAAVQRVIKEEFKRCEEKGMPNAELLKHMQTFTFACWVCKFFTLRSLI